MGQGGLLSGKPPLVARRVETWTRDYDLYQGPQGVVREELTRTTGQRSVGSLMDIKLLHYDAGWGLVFDKGGSTAIKGPLSPPTAARTIGTRTILGFVCDGKEYAWKTFQQATVQLRSWTAENSGLKVPLLEVEYFTDSTGSLIGLTIQYVASIEPAANLPDSLFEPPPGLHITNVPFIQ
jgi:hypothetical protein